MSDINFFSMEYSLGVDGAYVIKRIYVGVDRAKYIVLYPL